MQPLIILFLITVTSLKSNLISLIIQIYCRLVIMNNRDKSTFRNTRIILQHKSSIMTRMIRTTNKWILLNIVVML